MPDDSKRFFPDQPDFRVKRGLLTAAIAGGLLVAPACGDAQEQHFATVIAGDDIGLGLAKTFEEGGFLSIDLGLARGDSARRNQRSLVYVDIGGGFSLGAFAIAGILGLTLNKQSYQQPSNEQPEAWQAAGFRAGVGAIVFVREDLALGAKAMSGPHRGGSYSAWLGIVLDEDWLRNALEDRRRAVSWPN